MKGCSNNEIYKKTVKYKLHMQWLEFLQCLKQCVTTGLIYKCECYRVESTRERVKGEEKGRKYSRKRKEVLLGRK